MLLRNCIGICLVIISMGAIAQGGVNFRAGVGTMVTDEDQFTGENGAHYGWRGAMFARIGASDTWFFDPGISYEQYNVGSNDKFNSFEDEPKLHFLKGYVNIATFLIRNDLFKMRLSGGGNVTYLARIDDNPNYRLGDFNDATLGVNGGIGIDIWFLTADIGYEYGLTDFFIDKGDLSHRFWTLSAGVFF